MPWSWIGAAISILILIIASLTLFRLLRGVEFDKVAAALSARTMPEFAVATAWVMASYVALTFYDFFALRTIGRSDVPYRVAAFANFTSYTIGHNLGITVVAPRHPAADLCAVGALVLAMQGRLHHGAYIWLGNAFVLGMGLLSEPEAVRTISELPAWINRSMGLAALAVITAYLAWLLPRPRAVGRGRWRIVLPSSRLTLLQIAIGVADLSLATLAMQALLPVQPTIDFTALLVIFVAAVLLGFLSHAPGSLGVIEATMLVGLPQFPKEELLASLLVFRVLYFVTSAHG